MPRSERGQSEQSGGGCNRIRVQLLHVNAAGISSPEGETAATDQNCDRVAKRSTANDLNRLPFTETHFHQSGCGGILPVNVYDRCLLSGLKLIQSMHEPVSCVG